MKWDKGTRKRLITWTLIAGLLTTLLYGIWYRVHYENMMENSERYTAGITVDKYRSGRGKLFVDYEFSFKGEKITGFNSPYDPDDVKCPGGKYLVKFSTEDPEVNEMDFYQPVPESIEAPSKGWSVKELPEGLEGW